MKRSDLHQRVTGGETLGDEVGVSIALTIKSTAIVSNQSNVWFAKKFNVMLLFVCVAPCMQIRDFNFNPA